MVKVLQILAVFLLLMLVVASFFREKEERFREYIFLRRLRQPLPPEVMERLLAATSEEGTDGAAVLLLLEAATSRSYTYTPEGLITIVRQLIDGRRQVLQELSAPVNGTAMALDPIDRKLYLEADGLLFVFAPM